MAAENARVDTTFIGYLLIGFFLLFFGVFGLQEGNVFGDAYKDLPVDWNVLGQVAGAIGLILILLTIFAYRTGKQGSAGIFAFSGLYMIILYFNFSTKGSLESVTNSDWFLFVAIAIFFLIFAIYAAFNKAPKFVAVFLLLFALMIFFIGLACLYGPFGTDNVDVHKATSIVYAVFALLGFVVATYLGLAYANPKKIPLI